MLELVIKIMFPLTLSLSMGWAIQKTRTFNRFSNLEKIVLTLALSVSLNIILLSWYGVMGGRYLSTFIIATFIIGSTFLLYSLYTWLNKLPSLPKQLTQLEKLSLLIIFALLLKIFILYIFHPVIDADIIYTYLPFARTIHNTNSIPIKDIYTGNPMTIPPIGGPILFASTYILTNNIFSESFLFLTLPFLLGIILLTYLFARKIMSRQNSLFTVIIFLSFPVIDELLTSWTLYPDIIYTFLGLFSLYSVLYLFPQLRLPKSQISLSIIVAFALASALLLKSQGLFLIYSIIIVMIPMLSSQSAILRIISVIMISISLLISHWGVPGLTGFGVLPLPLLTLLIYIIIIVAFKCRSIKSAGLNSKINRVTGMFIVALSSLGLIWFYRNYRLYQNISVPLSSDYGNFYQLRTSINNAVTWSRQKYSLFSILAFPVFGTFFLIPKLAGILQIIKLNKLKFLGFWVLYWYVISIVYFGYINTRYVFITFPFLAIIIFYGLQYLYKHLLSAQKTSIAIFISLLLFATSSLLQSKFIFWNFGPSFSYSQSGIPSTSSLVSLVSDQDAVIPSKLRGVLQGIAKFLSFTNTQSKTIQDPAFFNLAKTGAIASLIILFTAYFLSQHTSRRKIFVYVYLASILLITPYIFILWRISEGSLSNFSVHEKQKIYHNNGESKYITPFLIKNAKPDSKILIFGPQTGISYKSNLITYNMEYGYGLKEIMSVINRSSEGIIDNFSINNIDYAIFYQSLLSQERVDNLDQHTNLIKTINNPQYFTKIIHANSSNRWELYRRNH